MTDSNWRTATKAEFDQLLERPGVTRGGFFDNTTFAYNEYAEIVGRASVSREDGGEQWTFDLAIEPVRTSSSKPRRVGVIAGGGPRMGKSLHAAAILAAASAAGMTVVRLDRGGRDITHLSEDEFYHDPLAELVAAKAEKRRQRYDDEVMSVLLPRRDVTHIDTPKPVSKRKARRLRGKERA